jgi:hypothetical protein
VKLTKRDLGTEFRIWFDGKLDAVSAQKLTSYILVQAGRDRRFGTKDDRRITLASVKYDAARSVVTLRTKTTFRASDRLQLRLLASRIHDSEGRPIDGNRDGRTGGDYVVGVSSIRK